MQAEFPHGAIVRHMVTRKTYKIVCSADFCRLAAGSVPAYAYQRHPEVEENIVWVRERIDMEERFVLEENAHG